MDLVGADSVDERLEAFGPPSSCDNAPPGGRKRPGGGFADA
jgi:hypothetical protein